MICLKERLTKKILKKGPLDRLLKVVGITKIECLSSFPKYLYGVDYGERDFRKSFNKSS